MSCKGCENYDEECEKCTCEGDCTTCPNNECRGCECYYVEKYGDISIMRCKKGFICDK